MPVSRQKAEDASEVVAAPPLNGHTLDRTFRRYKKYHRFCEIQRKNGASFEISREKQRTEMLNRKYFDNLRQQQALSGRVDEPRTTAKEQNGSTGRFEADGATAAPGAAGFVSVSVCVHACMCVCVGTQSACLLFLAVCMRVDVFDALYSV